MTERWNTLSMYLQHLIKKFFFNFVVVKQILFIANCCSLKGHALPK